MADKPSKWHSKLDVPNPERQIGTTADGQPIWIDLRELISSPDEKAERWANTLESRRSDEIDAAAKMVLLNAAQFIEETIYNISRNEGKKLYFEADGKAMFEYALRNGIQTIQDGLRTVVKVRGKVIRDMVAKIPVMMRESVELRVRTLVKTLPTQVTA